MRSLLALLLIVIAAPALAGSRPATGGDPAIDAQWRGFGGASAAPATASPPATVQPARRGLLQILFATPPQGAAPPQSSAPPVTEVRAPQAPLRRSAAGAPPPDRQIDAAFMPAVVDYPTAEAPGTIVIDTLARYLYLVLDGGRAQRYGVGVGREGFGWSGSVHVGRKAEWPTWTPPAAMRKRQPYLPVSMPGGPNNPLGARALYLYDGGRDTLFRIHGSNEPWTIGRSVSSGCFRMRNEDAIALYERVGVGTKVVVR